MTTFYQVDHLLSISRLADRLYPFIFGLKGREEMYQNPGTSLKSFLVVNLREELVELDNEQLENLQACEEFASAASVSVIVSRISDATRRAIGVLQHQVGSDRKKNGQLAELKNMLRDLEQAYEDVRRLFKFELLSPKGVHFKQALFTLQDKLTRLNLLEPDEVVIEPPESA